MGRDPIPDSGYPCGHYVALSGTRDRCFVAFIVQDERRSHFYTDASIHNVQRVGDGLQANGILFDNKNAGLILGQSSLYMNLKRWDVVGVVKVRQAETAEGARSLCGRKRA